jgi:hypothetical protein
MPFDAMKPVDSVVPHYTVYGELHAIQSRCFMPAFKVRSQQHALVLDGGNKIFSGWISAAVDGTYLHS